MAEEELEAERSAGAVSETQQADDSRRGRVARLVAREPRAARWPKSLLKICLDILLVSAGVFLGLMGDQWRENAQHRELAEASLRRFRAEIVSNREAVARVKDYHVTKKASLDRYFKADAGTRKTLDDVRLQGLQPVFFERTAWDLALATQSLAYLDPPLAFALSRVYTRQQDYARLTDNVMQAIYVRPPTEGVEAFLGAVNVYYGDVVLWEPALMKMYDDLLPQIDRVLGDSASQPLAGGTGGGAAR